MRFQFAPTFLALVLALAAGLALAGDSFPGFLPFSRGGGGGGGGGGLTPGAADAAYLRLDATNDPVTGDVYFGSPAGNSIALDGPNAFLWAQVLDSDASGNFAVVGTSAWNGTLWDASTTAASYGEGYPGNGYCTSIAQAPGSSEIWINGDPTSESRLCAPVGTGLDMGVSTGNGSTFENVLALTGTGAVVNEDGASDLDFRVEGDTQANLLMVDASSDRVGIGVAVPSTRFEVNGQAAAAVGSAAAPSWSFVGDLNTGWYRSAADSISWSVGGTEGGVLRGTEANFYLPISADYGSAAAPSIRWSAANTTGIYGSAVGVSTTSGGVRSATFGPGGAALYDVDGTTPLLGTEASRAYARGIVPTATALYDLGTSTLRWVQAHLGAGSVAAPSVTLGDTNTGIFSSAADRVDVSCGNQQCARFYQASPGEAYLALGTVAGSAATPSIHRTGDTDTGLGWYGADDLGISVGGTQVFHVTTSAVEIGNTPMLDLNFDTDTSLAAADCDSDSEVGDVYRYSKSAGATITHCICTKVASTYAFAALGAGDCT